MSHTPGPWKWAPSAVQRRKYMIWGNEKTGYDNATTPVADTANWMFSEPSEETIEANAALIAAAPDLLDALEFVRDYLYQTRGTRIELVESAIAKARPGSEGETSMRIVQSSAREGSVPRSVVRESVKRAKGRET